MIDRLVEFVTKKEIGDRGWEVVHSLIKEGSTEEVSKSGRQVRIQL